MKRVSCVVLALSTAVVGFAPTVPTLAAPSSHEEPEKHGFSTARLATLEARYKEGIAKGEIPGAAVIIIRNGKVIYDAALGFADRAAKVPMTNDTVFRLASMTKPVTSVAAMTLVEQGRLQLHEPVSTYLPELKGMKVGVVAENSTIGYTLVPADREPTIQDLLRHTAGLAYGQFGNTPMHRVYRDANLTSDDTSLADMITKLSRLPLVHQPGSAFEYSLATDVLGRVVEVASGQSLDQYIEDRIAKPLGLSSLKFHPAPGLRVARPDDPTDVGTAGGPMWGGAAERLRRNPKFLSGGAGLYATAGDYARFAQMLLNGGELDGVRVLAPKTVALMTSNHLSAEVAYPSSMRSLLGVIAPTPEMGQGFGLGFAVRTDVGQNPSPGSVGDFYWAGASGTYFWVDPQEQLVVVALTAQPKVDVKIRYRQLARQLVYQALEAPLAQRDAVWSSSSARRQKAFPAREVRGELPSLVP